MTADEIAGLQLFVGTGGCINCHNCPLLTDNYFHNTGVPAVPGLPEDRGREAGARQVRGDPFNCLGPYSDAEPADCAELRFMAPVDEEMGRDHGAYRTGDCRVLRSCLEARSAFDLLDVDAGAERQVVHVDQMLT